MVRCDVCVMQRVVCRRGLGGKVFAAMGEECEGEEEEGCCECGGVDAFGVEFDCVDVIDKVGEFGREICGEVGEC